MVKDIGSYGLGLHCTVLCLGGNIAPRETFLEQAVLRLEETAGRIVRQSSLYETAAWGFSAGDFLNRIVLLETGLSPMELLRTTQRIEQILGRKEKTPDGGPYHDRPIDIDILFYDHLVMSCPGLQIPHPRIAQRRFVLEGLMELIPDFVHPVSEKKIRTLYNECTDSLKVVRTDDVSR